MEIALLEAEEAAEREFGSLWYSELSAFYQTVLMRDDRFQACNNKLGASSEYWLVIHPFTHPPTARYILGDPAKAATLSKSQQHLLTMAPMAIRYGTRIEDFVPWAPGGSLYRALLNVPPFGYVEPIRNSNVDINSIPARIVKWIESEQLLLDEGRYYLMPLFYAHIPLYVVLFGYGEKRQAALQAFRLGGLIDAMQECQESFSELFTRDALRSLLNKCAMKARSLNPRFCPSVLLERAEFNNWQNWYACVPGRQLTEVRNIASRIKELQTEWRAADKVDPTRIWDTIEAQFCGQGFFDSRDGMHEMWTLKHEEKRPRILTFLKSLQDHLQTHSASTLNDNTATDLVVQTITMLEKGHEEHAPLIDTKWPYFDRLKCLYCRCSGGRADAAPRLRQATLTVCLELALGVSASPTAAVFKSTPLPHEAYSPRPDVVANNAWEEAWCFCKVVKVLKNSIGAISIQGSSSDSESTIEVTVSFDSPWSGTGGSSEEIRLILCQRGCPLPHGELKFGKGVKLVGLFTGAKANESSAAAKDTMLAVTYRLLESEK